MSSSHRPGMVLGIALGVLGIVSLILNSYFTLVQHELTAGRRSVGRVQALYLAEAGLDAANDLAVQDWAAAVQGEGFPIRSTVTAEGDVAIGEYEVRVRSTGERMLEVTSTGRTLPTFDADGTVRYSVERTVVATLAARVSPRYSRLGTPVELELAVDYRKDGLPQAVFFSGRVSGSRHVLSSGMPESSRTGLHLVASFQDFDHDGDLDILLAELRPDDHPGSIRAMPLGAADAVLRANCGQPEDLLGTGQPPLVMTTGWVVLPPAFLRPGPGVDVFVNRPVINGVSLASWSELAPAQAVAARDRPQDDEAIHPSSNERSLDTAASGGPETRTVGWNREAVGHRPPSHMGGSR